MKYFRICFTLCLLSVFFNIEYTLAQALDKTERLRIHKIAFFTEKLQLSPEEAQQFWPIYNEYQKSKNKIIEDRKNTSVHFIQNLKTLTDKEIEELTDRYIQSFNRETELLLEYYGKFKAVLPIRKVMRIYQAENQYKNFLLRQIRDQRENPLQRRRF
jgi:hypothetical protein